MQYVGRWGGGTPPLCFRFMHKPITINPRMVTVNGTYKIMRCYVCGATKADEVK